MKIVIPILGVIAILALWLVLRSRTQTAAGKAPPAAPKEVYFGLRNQMLQGSRAKFSLPATSAPGEPWGIVMDWGVTNGTATVVALSDGSASVYLSSGGGFIGGIGQEPIRKAAQNAVSVAREFKARMTGTTTYPLPQRGEVTFYALTDSGVLTAKGRQEDLSAHRDPLSRLGDAMQAVITEYRLWEQQKATEPK
jgi:hypothetical protein